MNVSKAARFLWAKTDRSRPDRWHPLLLHMIDAAASTEAILEREPGSTRARMAEILGMEWGEARPWLMLLIACHDLGKACPGFQCKAPQLSSLSELNWPRSPNADINHGYVSQIALALLLEEKGWPRDLAELAADAVGCHHGVRASPRNLFNLEGDRRALGDAGWDRARKNIFEILTNVLEPPRAPAKPTLSGPGFMLLSGLASFADWISSNESWFPFGSPEDCEDPEAWLSDRRNCAVRALDAIGWAPRAPLSQRPEPFEKVFGFAPRPLQIKIGEILAGLREPAVILLEAPMGEGKTEAAFFAHLELQRKIGHRGLYIALPTKATGDAMFRRTLDFLRRQGSGRSLDLQLLHGAALLNDSFADLRLTGIYDPQTGGGIRAGEWFTHKKRALLSEYGVGTVDQALFPILPVKHNFVRMWGLANRVVVFDEIHAYDAYTGTLLVHLLRWLLALGSSIVLLSATLPPSVRRKLAGIVNADLPELEVEYPRVTLFVPGTIKQTHFEADRTRRKSVRLSGISADLSDMRATLEMHLGGGGMGLALVNTVQRAQDLYRLFPPGEALMHEGQRVGKRIPDGTEIFLLHARFPADRRLKREDHALSAFGEKSGREGRKLLIATQIVEQSLDLDFDLIATDLAPIDLVLQRAGRLWRHFRRSRILPEPALIIGGLVGDEPPDFGSPLWWGAVYREDVLLRTWNLLRSREDLLLPDEIDSLVRAVYDEEKALPEPLRSRLEKALEAGDGEAIAKRVQADQAVIGSPDDASWNEPERFVLYDEDESGVHRTLMAQTRLGKESIIAIPLFPQDGLDPAEVQQFPTAKTWFLRSLTISRKRVAETLKRSAVPQGWKQSPLLRNCYPLVLDQQGRWTEDSTVRLDDDLGLIYDSKEVE